MKQLRNPEGRPIPGAALRTLIAIVALVATLVACSTTPAPRSASTPKEVTPPPIASEQSRNPTVMLPRGPFYSAPLQLGYVPEGKPQEWLRPLAVSDEVEMKALLISATRNVAEEEPAAGAWISLLEQTGTPYDWFVASEEALTPSTLVREDGVGRYQAILLSTSNLIYAPLWESALDSGEWAVLFDYERDFGVRQAALYGEPYSAPESLGLATSTPAQMGGKVLLPTPAGLEVFTDLHADTQIELYGTGGFPSRGPALGTTPLLMDGDDILAVLTDTDGRERVTMLYNNPAWGETNQLAIYAQQIGPSLLRWALRGVHIGERHASYQADVDDWFFATGFWDTSIGAISETTEFNMTAQDAHSLVAQQKALRLIGDGVASEFAWSMAFNGEGAVPSSVVDCDLPVEQHTLSSMTRCLASEFRWVNHTWSHEYMDWIPSLPNPGLNLAQVTSQISQNDALATAMGLNPTYSRRSLVTGDISGLGWYAPDGPDTGDKVDFGLDHSSPHLLGAVVATDRSYLASNMSTASHEPDCWACGVVHPMNPDVFLVPRWPTNLFATVTTPEAVTDSYNRQYGPGGAEQIDPSRTEPYTYEEILEIDTDVALIHLLAGSPYPHYFHIPNFYEYLPERSTLYDWTALLFAKYAALVDEPLLSYTNDETGDYVRARTEFLDVGVTGIWNRATNQVTLTAANAGPVFFTGASLGGDSNDIDYNGRVISERQFNAGQVVTLSVGPATPTGPTISNFAATSASIVNGTSTDLAWEVTGTTNNVTLRAKGGADIVTSLPASGNHTVSPTATTTYELVASWTGGPDVIAETTVTVTEAPVAPAIAFSAASESIVDGTSTKLVWEVTGATTNITLRAKGGAEIATSLPATGNHTVSPNATTTYELVASWTGGPDVIAETTVTVTEAPVAPAISSFSATPYTVVSGDDTQLAWVVTGTTTDIILRVKSGAGIVTSLPATGNHTVSPNATTTYELVASWTGGPDVISETTVTVAPPVDPEVVTHTLRLELSGNGFGIVIASPGGNACIDECEIEVPAGTTVTLTPVALLGSTFDGFTGACNGRSCTITLDGDVNIGARFEFKD